MQSNVTASGRFSPANPAAIFALRSRSSQASLGWAMCDLYVETRPTSTGSRSTADPTQIHPSGYFGQPEVCDLGLTEASFERQLAEG